MAKMVDETNKTNYTTKLGIIVHVHSKLNQSISFLHHFFMRRDTISSAHANELPFQRL